MNFKTVSALSAISLLLVACVHHRTNDAGLQQRLAGTWTTRDFTVSHAMLSDIKLVLGPDGSYSGQYIVNRPDGSEQAETLTGTWRVEKGMFLENLTNSAGKATESNGGSKILKVTDNHFVISNWTSPHRVFTRTQ